MLPLLPPWNGTRLSSVWNFRSCSSDIILHLKPVVTLQNVGRIHKLVVSGCNAKKVIFKACHSGKLKLTFTSPNIISTSPKKRVDEYNWFHSSSVIWIPQKNFTCPSGKFKRTEYRFTTFFARWVWPKLLLFLLIDEIYSFSSLSSTVSKYCV